MPWDDDEEGSARALSGIVMMCTEAVYNVEAHGGSAKRVAAAVVIIRDAIAKSRKLSADYLASGHASAQYRVLVEQSEGAFKQLEDWCASKSGRA